MADDRLDQIDVLSHRALNALRNEGIETIQQLKMYTEAELLRIPNFGRVSLMLAKEALAEHGLQPAPSLKNDLRVAIDVLQRRFDAIDARKTNKYYPPSVLREIVKIVHRNWPLIKDSIAKELDQHVE